MKGLQREVNNTRKQRIPVVYEDILLTKITCVVGVLHLTLAPTAYHDFEDICVGVYEQIRSHPPTEISAKT